VSNAQLLEILSETKEPSRVARYLNKIFEGINALEFNDDQEITHIKSYTGEVISLTKNVSTAKARGQVDRWLADLDKQMKESLQKEFKMALSNYLDKSMRDWVDNLPSQIVTCGLQATWTAEIQKVSINCGSLWFYFLGWQQTTKISKSSDKFYFHCPNFSVEVHGFFFKYNG
jgi:dynein heavy chain